MLATSVSGPLLGWWSAALAVGLVVAVVLVGLLHRLLHVVRQIERGAQAVWLTGKEMAGNTSTTWMLDGTGRALDEFRDELQRHEALLDGRP